MADVRDWGAFIRGRWDWTRFGYEKNFPRKCAFTDIDAFIEFDGRSLTLEAKHWDGVGEIPRIETGQLRSLQYSATETDTVLVLWGCASCNDPLAVRNIGTDEFFDWRAHTKPERRREFKALIDKALGVS